MQMKCKCNANEMKCDQMPNKCIILGTIQYQYLAHNSHNYPNHMSLELGIELKRVVPVFVILFCFAVVVHLLFSKVVAHLDHSFVVKAC